MSTAESAFDRATSRERCRRYRKRILDISQALTAVHVAPAFSCLEILDTIYHGFVEPSGRRDSFILSKGHGVMAQYVVLEGLGIIDSAELDSAVRDGSRIGAHPDLGLPGIQASTGSLGHGLPIAVGIAYANQLSGVDARVFAVLSDGEMQEGSTWEAVMLAPSLGLSGLIAVVDLNDFQSLARISEVFPNFYPVAEKFEAFGWEAVTVQDGHDAGSLYAAISGRSGERPLAIVAHTTKGKGVSFMEHVPIWHYRSPSPAEYEQALRELESS